MTFPALYYLQATGKQQAGSRAQTFPKGKLKNVTSTWVILNFLAFSPLLLNYLQLICLAKG